MTFRWVYHDFFATLIRIHVSEVDLDPAKWNRSDRIQIRNTFLCAVRPIRIRTPTPNMKKNIFVCLPLLFDDGFLEIYFGCGVRAGFRQLAVQTPITGSSGLILFSTICISYMKVLKNFHMVYNFILRKRKIKRKEANFTELLFRNNFTKGFFNGQTAKV